MQVFFRDLDSFPFRSLQSIPFLVQFKHLADNILWLLKRNGLVMTSYNERQPGFYSVTYTAQSHIYVSGGTARVTADLGVEKESMERRQRISNWFQILASDCSSIRTCAHRIVL